MDLYINIIVATIVFLLILNTVILLWDELVVIAQIDSRLLLFTALVLFYVAIAVTFVLYCVLIAYFGEDDALYSFFVAVVMGCVSSAALMPKVSYTPQRFNHHFTRSSKYIG